MSKTSEAIENKAEKLDNMCRLLIECRDALPAISRTSARLRGVKLDLGRRIEHELEPWEVPADTPGAI